MAHWSTLPASTRLSSPWRHRCFYRGLALVVTLGTPVSKLPEAFRVFGYRGFLRHGSGGVSMAIVVLLLALPLLFKKCVGVGYIMTLGSNPLALRRSGVRLGLWLDQRLCADGLSFSPGGDDHHGTAQFRGAQRRAEYGDGCHHCRHYGWYAAAWRPGRADWDDGGGAALLSSIRNGLTLLRISSYYQQLITSGVILLVPLSRRSCGIADSGYKKNPA